METRARTTDPATSHEAAANVESFRSAHYDRILAALRWIDEPMTYVEIAKQAEMEPVAVNRRLKELRDIGAIKRAGRRTCTIRGTKMETHRIVTHYVESRLF